MDLWKKLQRETRPIVLYGMGNGAQAVLHQLEQIGVKPKGIFASDSFVRGQSFCGYTVKKYSDLAQQYPDMIILVCFGTAREEVLQNIADLALRHEVYCPDVPVYGSEVFTLEYARRHRNEIEKVYNLLGDEFSRKTFEAILLFKLSGKSDYLHKVEYTGTTFSPLSLNDAENYLDLGAYRGDTIWEFLDTVEGYEQIYAVEPNRKTFAKLKEQTKNVENLICLHAAASDYDGEACIYSAGRGSTVGFGGDKIQTITVDGWLDQKKVTLIKMDVEGEEAAVICGAHKTIDKYKPKMVIASYHRSGDIFSIPLLIHEIRPDYRILIRHFRHNLAWDTNFYFI